MRILLDTHCWLWLQVTPERISDRTRNLLSDPANELLLSAASAWEIAVKYSLGKLPLPRTPELYVPSRMRQSGTSPLPVEIRHALRVRTLPQHHRDPFDRLLIAQAQVERLSLLTADPQFRSYEVRLIEP
jgi:PIN domain nuclease of toxin-antitoxin system